jgi:hypothetical protein
MLAAIPGWHRTRVVLRGGSLRVELDGQPVLEGPAPAGAGPLRLELRPDGMATEYANLFLGPAGG